MRVASVNGGFASFQAPPGRPSICPNTSIGAYSLPMQVYGYDPDAGGLPTRTTKYYDTDPYVGRDGTSSTVYTASECISVADIANDKPGRSEFYVSYSPGLVVKDPARCSVPGSCAAYTPGPGRTNVRFSKIENECRGLIEIKMSPMTLPNGANVCVNCGC